MDEPRTVAYRSISWGTCELTLEHDGRRVTHTGTKDEARAACMADLGLSTEPEPPVWPTEFPRTRARSVRVPVVRPVPNVPAKAPRYHGHGGGPNGHNTKRRFQAATRIA